MFTRTEPKQDGKMAEKVIKRYSMTFKKQVVQEYEGGTSIARLQRKYGIANGPTIKRWISQYSREGVRHQVMHIQRPEEQEQVKELQQRLAELEKLVAQLSLDKFMLESSLAVAEEQLGYELKKKTVTTSSAKRWRGAKRSRSK
jgi:transposase-like protein